MHVFILLRLLRLLCLLRLLLLMRMLLFLSQDPQVVGDPAAEQYLHAFVALSEQAEALRRFAVVNSTALRKIVKKYKRRGPGLNTKRGKDDNGDASKDVEQQPQQQQPQQQQQQQQCVLPLPAIQLECEDGPLMTRLLRLQRDLQSLGDELMVSSSTFHEYVCSLRTQYWAQLAEHQATVREAHRFSTRPRARRLAMLTDFRKTFSPAIMLVSQTVVVLATLIATYTISSNTVDNDGNTVFDRKGVCLCVCVCVCVCVSVCLFSLPRSFPPSLPLSPFEQVCLFWLCSLVISSQP